MNLPKKYESAGIRYFPVAERILLRCGLIAAAIGIILILALTASSMFADGMIERPFCFHKECLGEFIKGYEYPLSALKIIGACIVGFATTYGLIVALAVYASNSDMVRYQAESARTQANSLTEQAKSAALQLHSVRFSAFREYVSEALSRCTRLGTDCIDVTTWYFKIHPKSYDGDITVNKYYLNAITDISRLMTEADDSLGAVKKRFNYRDHQTASIALFLEIGIRLESLPRIDYFLVEDEVVNLITSVHRVFGVPSASFGSRNYRNIL